MTTWPSTLPQRFEKDGFKDSEPTYGAITQMDVGPPKLRKRCSIAPREFSGSMLCTGAQKTELKIFYNTYCSSPFEFPDPDTGELINVVFASYPNYSGYNGEFQMISLKIMQVAW